MKSLMRPGTGRQRLCSTPEGGVAVGDGGHHDAQGHEVVDLVEVDALAAQLLVDGVEALDAPLEGGLEAGRLQLLRHRGLDLLDELGGLLAPLLHALGELLVGLAAPGTGRTGPPARS